MGPPPPLWRPPSLWQPHTPPPPLSPWQPRPARPPHAPGAARAAPLRRHRRAARSCLAPGHAPCQAPPGGVAPPPSSPALPLARSGRGGARRGKAALLPRCSGGALMDTCACAVQGTIKCACACALQSRAGGGAARVALSGPGPRWVWRCPRVPSGASRPSLAAALVPVCAAASPAL